MPQKFFLLWLGLWYRPWAKMVGKSIAFLLAVIIGNPMCCCAVATLFADDSPTQPKPTLHSCCSHLVEDDKEKSPPNQPAPCTCFVKKDRSLAESEVTPPKANVSNESANSPLQADSFFLHLPLSPVVGCLKKWPPGSLPISSLSERIALHCCYLLWFFWLEGSP